MAEIWVIICASIAGLYWLAAMRCKDVAVAVARRECRLCDVQLLDQTVHQTRISLSKDSKGGWRIWREYRFEYSHDGESRSRGRLMLLGHSPVRVDMETFNPAVH